MCRKHFTVSIYVHATVFGLFQQFFQIMQVMSAYQNTGAGTCSYIYMGNFRITITGSVCLVEQSHCSNAYFTCFSANTVSSSADKDFVVICAMVFCMKR